MEAITETMQRYADAMKWFDDVYKIKITICKSKNNVLKPYWANILYKGEIESSDYYPTRTEAMQQGLHIAFSYIK